MLRDPKIPKAYEKTAIKVKTPIVNDQLSRLVGQLTANPVTFTVTPNKPGPTALERASRLERAAEALFRKLSIEAYGTPGKLLRKGIDKAVSQGEGVWKLWYRPHSWELRKFEREDSEDASTYLDRVMKYKGEAQLPIRSTIVDRSNFYYIKDDNGLQVAMEITKRRAIDIVRDWDEPGKDALRSIGVPVPGEGKISSYNPGLEITLIEYWDREWTCYVIYSGAGSVQSEENGARLIDSFRHGYPRLPYFIGVGEETSSDDPNYEHVSAAYPIKHLAPFQDSLFTMWANVAYFTGFPTWREKPIPGNLESQVEYDEDEEDEPVNMTPGTIIKGDIEPLQYGNSTQALTQMASAVGSMMQGSMLPAIMQGQSPGTRTPGFAIQELASAAKAKYHVTVESCGQALSEMMNFAFWIIEHMVAQPLPLATDMVDDKTGRKYRDFSILRPDDIDGFYAVEAEIKPTNPAERYQQATVMANMKAAGAATTRQVIEAYGEPHPDEIMDEMLVEEWMGEPDIKQFIRQRALQKAGLAGLNEQIEAAKQMFQQQAGLLSQATGMPGGPGAAPGAGSGSAGGVPSGTSTGAPSTSAPKSPGMEVNGMPRDPGQVPTNPAGQPDTPRMYKPRGNAGLGRNQQNRPSINGFPGRK